MAPPEANMAAKSFTPPQADRAYLYVYRNESLGSLIKINLAVDGSVVGTTTSKTFVFVALPPGRHTLESKSRRPPLQCPDLNEPVSTLDLEVAGGQTAFVWQEVKSGTGHAKSELHLVSAGVGRAGVAECDLVGPPPPEDPPDYNPVRCPR